MRIVLQRSAQKFYARINVNSVNGALAELKYSLQHFQIVSVPIDKASHGSDAE